MIEAELWLPRAQRRRFHRPRLRRQRRGELVQVDGSEHRWFEDRAPPCTLLVFVDDATSTPMQARFVPSETTFACFEALEGDLRAHGRPVALAIVLGAMADHGSPSDKHTVVRLPKPGRHGSEMTEVSAGRSRNSEARSRVPTRGPGGGPRRAGEPHAPGSAREGAAPRGRLGDGGRQRDAPGLCRGPQRALRQDAGAPRRPAPAAQPRARPAARDPVPARPRLT